MRADLWYGNGAPADGPAAAAAGRLRRSIALDEPAAKAAGGSRRARMALGALGLHGRGATPGGLEEP